MPEPVDFHDFVAARRKRLLRSAWLLTGDWAAAEDLVQTALVRCYPHWRRIATDNPDAYVRRTLFNTYASWRRRRWHGELSTADLPQQPAEGDQYAAADERHRLLSALDRLPARQRATLVLRYFEDLSERDTAVALDCSVGTVKSQTAKALAHLRTSGVLLDPHQENEVAHD